VYIYIIKFFKKGEEKCKDVSVRIKYEEEEYSGRTLGVYKTLNLAKLGAAENVEEYIRIIEEIDRRQYIEDLRKLRVNLADIGWSLIYGWKYCC